MPSRGHGGDGACGEESESSVDDASQQVAQELARFHRALRQQGQEAERRLQEALLLQKQETERKLQQALLLQKQEAERRLQEAVLLQEQESERRLVDSLRLQEQGSATALREAVGQMERKLQEKDDAIRALQQRLQEVQERVAAVEGGAMISEGPAGEGALPQLEARVRNVEEFLQHTIDRFFPRLEVVLRQLEEPSLPKAHRASSNLSASARPATASAGPSSPGPLHASASTAREAAAAPGEAAAGALEEERARQRVHRRMREAEERRDKARAFPCPLGEELCAAVRAGKRNDVVHLLDFGADINYTDETGSNPLRIAVFKKCVDVLSLLLERRADVNAANTNASTALHLACSVDKSGRLASLLIDAGADVDARALYGATSLHYAARDYNVAATQALLAAGARRDLKGWGGGWEDKTPFDVRTSAVIRDLLNQ